MSNGFIQIPRTLLNLIEDFPLPQRWLMVTIIERACYQEKTQNDHGIDIKLEPGQLLCTYRKLAEWAGVTKNDVERGVKRFLKDKIVRQEVRHSKTILTIVHNDTRRLFSRIEKSEVRQKVRQERDKSETQTNKEEQIKVCSVVLSRKDARKKSHKKGKKMTIHYQTNNFMPMTISENQIYAHFIRKPYPPEIVQETVKRLLGRVCKTNDILKYAEGICKNLMKQLSKEPMKEISVAEEKIIKINYKPLEEYEEFNKIVEDRKKELRNAG